MSKPYASKFGKMWSECESKQPMEPRGMNADPSSSDFEGALHHRKLVSELETHTEKIDRHADFMSPVDVFPPTRESARKEPSPTSRFPELAIAEFQRGAPVMVVSEQDSQYEQSGLSEWALARSKNQHEGLIRKR